MPRNTIAFGIVLVLLGLVAYIASAMASITALIPSFFGLVFLILGITGLREGLRKHAMHASAAVGLLGFIGTVMGLVKLFSLLAGADVERPYAVIVQAIMALLCLIYIGLAVRSFIAARRGR